MSDYIERACSNCGSYLHHEDNCLNNNILPVYTPAESLTKENFFNDLNSKYPSGMKVFCDWIDSYKKAVNWKNLFNDGFNQAGDWGTEGWGGSTTAPKYHDLPFAMQIGIWIAFTKWMSETLPFNEISVPIYCLDIEEDVWKRDIEATIDDLNLLCNDKNLYQ